MRKRTRDARRQPDETDLVVAGPLALLVLAACARLGQVPAGTVLDGSAAAPYCRWARTVRGAPRPVRPVLRRPGR
ncbi:MULTISPECIES: hypothetical protein [unclassified Streptomyces]|uniref:hypothetical protein n=1 Tax=unclassified Streptomyces TaxID=2593676 RepID=UPI00081F0A30|nr:MULTISPECIES: hypothetical protein [unclassified Streptomyces]MYR26512.1 hypothetical protein [Streptomyces sp. SID4945]SCF04875.1 hypothetical protein GA0115257_106234 [Streptomyces sp. LcepLS]